MNVSSYIKIKNSTHPNEKILRLKQHAKFKTIHKNIFITLFIFKLQTNIIFQNNKELKEKKCFET